MRKTLVALNFDFSGDAEDGRCVVRYVEDQNQCINTAKYEVMQNSLTHRHICENCLTTVIDKLGKRGAVLVRLIVRQI